MLKYIHTLSIVFFGFYSFCFAQSSVLEKGDWYKFQIDKHGVYKITYNQLKDIGINPDAIDPKKIAIYGNGAGMLPQKNSAERPIDLVENRILVEGEDDGKFNSDDYIIFYAEGPDAFSYSSEGLAYTRNIYSSHNYYYLTIKSENGKRLITAENEGNNFSKITEFDDFIYYKEEKTNLLSSGRDWYKQIRSENFNYDIPGLKTTAPAYLTSAVMVQSFAESSFTISANGTEIGKQTVPPVPNFLTPSTGNPNRYAVKGNEDYSTYTIAASNINGSSLNIKYQYNENSSGRVQGYLKEFYIQFKRALALNEKSVLFRSISSTENTSNTFEISGCSEQTLILNVSSPYNASNQKYSLNNGKAIFGSTNNMIEEYVVFNPANLDAPNFVSQVENQNLHALSTPDFLIITHSDFENQAMRLAAHRSSQDKLSTTVVELDKIYNEFSSGKQDVSAIRDFIKHLYDRNQSLKYVLLLGKGTYDYKDINERNVNFVPVYESRNSLHPLQTYCSDDFYGFLEDDEGEWAEVAGGNHSMEVGIGRIPATTPEEAEKVIDKIINYSSNKTLGTWRNKVAFVADDGDNNLHVRQSNDLATFMDTTYSKFNYVKVFLDSYQQNSSQTERNSPDMIKAIDETVKSGVLIMNYTGHGGTNSWAQENILYNPQIESWNNKNKLPLFVTATCEFGRHDDLSAIKSGGETILLTEGKGGIASISTCRPVYASSNFELNKAFYSAVFEKRDGEYLRLGDIIRLTKNESADEAVDANKIGNRNFVLLGDPSLKLNYPQKDIMITSINGTDVIDTLNALEKVNISGSVLNETGQEDVEFSGNVFINVHDKEATLTTLGNESSPFNYKSRENAIFQGQSTAAEGRFTAEFIVPKSISYQLETGKISLYAVSDSNAKDAGGGDLDIIVGGSADVITTDTDGPEIELYFGDSTYTSDLAVNTNTLLLVKLSDESGINVSGYNAENSITATLDGGNAIILNKYYMASPNTYQTGWLSYPMINLTPGKHTLTLKAWDTYNNSNHKTIDFTVNEEGTLILKALKNSPNPFQTFTTFSFEHNRVGEDLKVELEILNRQGQGIIKQFFNISDAPGNVTLYRWDGNNTFGEKILEGLYIYKLTVRSLLDGAKNHTYQKLILIN